jgi:hypothetical protein
MDVLLKLFHFLVAAKEAVACSLPFEFCDASENFVQRSENRAQRMTEYVRTGERLM